MKRAYSADPTVLAELAAVLRSIAAKRRLSRPLLREMASAYDTRAAMIGCCGSAGER